MNTYKFNWDVIAAVCPEYKAYLTKQTMPEGPGLNRINYMSDRMVVENSEERDVLSEMCDDSAFTGSILEDMDVEETDQESEEKNIHYELQSQYKNPSIGENYNPLQLLPPKRFLETGSTLRQTIDNSVGYGLEYRILHNKYKDHTRDLVKMKLSIDGDKIRLIHAKYWFDQRRGIASDRRGEFKCLVYNTRTHNLYFMSRQEHKNLKTGSVRYSNKVRGVLWSKDVLHMSLSCFGIQLVRNFIILLERAVRKDVPDIFIPENRATYRGTSMIHVPESGNSYNVIKIIALIVQHKVGCRLDWMQPELIRNIHRLIYIREFENQLSKENMYKGDEWEERDRKASLEVSNRVRKVVPTIRKYRSPKKLLKALCGKHYYGLLLKMVFIKNRMDEHDWINLMKLHGDNEFPKPLYHWLNELLKADDVNSEAIAQVLNVIHRFSDRWTASRELGLIDQWVKLNRRFVVKDSKPMNWDLWRDTYNMANDLHIRLRPNKFNSAEEIREVHNKLAGFQRRNVREQIKYDNAVFEKFDIPDKEYEGFQFVQLKSAKDLVHEGTTMHHCVGGYSRHCVSGRSIIFSMRKDDRSYVTIELCGDTYAIRQQYTIHDNLVTSAKALGIIGRWHKDVLKMHEEDKILYTDLCQADLAKKEAELRKNTAEELTILEEGLCQSVMEDTHNDPIEVEEETDFIDLLEEVAYGSA